MGMQEILIIALVILLLFGGKKIPELMKGLGKGVKSFKEGMEGTGDDTEAAQIEDKSNASQRQSQQEDDGSSVHIGRMGNKGQQYTDDGSSVSMDGMGSSRQQYADDGSSVHIGRMDGKAEPSDDGTTVTLNNIGRQN